MNLERRSLPGGSMTAATEINLLELFAPAGFNWLSSQQKRDATDPSLWRLDAIHRARNLAQLATSMSSLIARRSDSAVAAEIATPARALARAYESLVVDCGTQEAVPCFELVSEVANKLAQIFGSERGIDVTIAGTEVRLAPERRRALVLICSELVINALKYAFPVKGPGHLSVSLTHVRAGVLLVVEDDGPGLAGDFVPGKGTGLLDRLAVNSEAVLVRKTGHSGNGLRVEVLLLPPENARADTRSGAL